MKRRRAPLPENLEPASCDLPALLKRLSLPTVRRLLDETERIAVDHQMGHREFLAHLVVAEVLNRDQTRMQRMTRQARFPFLSPVETLTFAPKGNLRRDLIAPFLAPDYVASGKHLILSGKTGRGKTALAIAIAIKAIQHGADGRFVTAADLIDQLTVPAQRGELQTAVEPFIAAKVLIIDEIGYLPHASDAANVLYTIVEARHRLRRPIILTTNKPLKQWGSVLHDADLAEAILDRLLQDGRHINIVGRSWRTGREDDHASADSAAEPVAQGA
jgi:DNA replication protein DnaC